LYKNLVRMCKVVMLTTVMFIIFTSLAILAFPGGTKIDRAAVHYDFSQNFFSDLGATNTISGKSNTISNLLFITAFGSLGIVLIYFSRIWRAISIDVLEMKLIGISSKIALIMSGFSFIVVAFTPWNKFFDYHVIFLKTAFGFLLIWSILITTLQMRNPKMRDLMFINIAYILLLGWYIYTLFFGLSIGTEKVLEFQAISQKIIIYSSIANLFIQAFGIKHFLRSADFRRSGTKNFYV